MLYNKLQMPLTIKMISMGWHTVSNVTKSKQWITFTAPLVGFSTALLHMFLVMLPLRLVGQRYKATHKDGDVQAAWNASLVERYRYSGRHYAWIQ